MSFEVYLPILAVTRTPIIFLTFLDFFEPFLDRNLQLTQAPNKKSNPNKPPPHQELLFYTKEKNEKLSSFSPLLLSFQASIKNTKLISPLI